MERTRTKVVDETDLGVEVDGPEGRATTERQARDGPTKKCTRFTKIDITCCIWNKPT